MSISITNTSSLFSSYQLQKNDEMISNSLNRIASGQRINKAADDASGMVIADNLGSQARGFGQAIRNANDAISIAQVADGALDQATELIQGIRVMALRAANASHSPESLQVIQADIDKSLQSLTDIAQNTSFNDQKLLSGTFTDKQFQTGASSGETVEISLGSIDPSQISEDTLGTLADIDVTTQEGAQNAIKLADMALEYVGEQRSNMGSRHNQLESTINNLSTARINTMSAESQIRDLDYAEESMNLNRMNMLNKAKTFAYKMSNESSKQIMNLLE